MIVFEFLEKTSTARQMRMKDTDIARRTRFKSTCRVSGFTGIELSLIPKYAAALSNAA
jgi:hypothetical protein